MKEIEEIINCTHEKEHLKAFELHESYKDNRGNTIHESLHIQCKKCGVIMKVIANGKAEMITKQVLVKEAK